MRVSVGCLLLLLCCCGDQLVTVPEVEAVAGEASGDQSLKPLPPAPESQVLDRGGVFAHAPDELAKMTQFLNDLRDKHQIEIFVAMYGFLDGESVEARANRLREAWANHNSGMVVVYESGSEGLSFVANDEIDAMLTRHDLDTILQSAGTAAQNEKGSENQIRAAVHTLADSLVSKLERRRKANELTAKKRMLVMASTLASIVLVTLVGMLIARFISKADRKSGEFYYFPSARVESRFGASFCGGAGAEIRFK